MRNINRPISATIKDQVYHILKNDICDRYYKPGQWLQEKELAARLNVSRSPVREALRELASDGLVTEIPNKGVFVRRFSPKDISDIFDMRVMLENYCISHSPARLTAELTDELLRFIPALKAAHDEYHLEEYIDIDTDLHRFIIRLGGNAIVENSYNGISSMIQPFRIYSLTDVQRFDDSVVEHTNMIRSIADGDVEKAAQANRQHLEFALRDILAYLERNAEGEA